MSDYAILQKLLESAFENGQFSPERFFKSWFEQEGKSYYFLFRKNLKVTNIQFSELLVLISDYMYCSTGNAAVKHCQFMSTDSFKRVIKELVEEFCNANDTYQEACQAIAELYGGILGKTIAVETLYGSCAVFLPPKLEIELKSICAFSGYIHSCGKNVFLQHVDKTRKEDLFAAIKLQYLPDVESGRKGLFIVYAHEDFDKYDRAEQDMLRNGLDAVKIHIEKFYMGKERLSAVINEARKKFAQTVVIPYPGNYRTRHDEAVANDEIDRRRTLWLLVDTAVDVAHMQRGDARYYIAYEQLWKNKNPHHIFDEDKPAWISQTTIPHTLMGAMLNITRPFLRMSWQQVSFADPFGGSGTSLMEAHGPNGVLFQLSDIHLGTPLLVADNQAFFRLGIRELEAIRAMLVSLGNSPLIDVDIPVPLADLESSGEPGRPVQMEIDLDDSANLVYRWAIDVLDDVAKNYESIGVVLSEDVIAKLKSAGLRNRIVFYVALRALVRNRGAWDRKSKTWSHAFFAELHELVELIKRLEKLLSCQELVIKTCSNDDVLVFQDTYSYGVSKQMANSQEGTVHVTVQDAKHMPADCFDVIVTDPPYGFNTDEDCAEIATLYVKAIPAMIKSLRPNGQIVLCLPDQTFTGRTAASFIHKEFVLAQFRLCASKMGRELVELDVGGPLPHVYSPPYTWESEKALRRAIIHLRIL